MYGLNNAVNLRCTRAGLFYGPVTLVGKSAIGAFEPRDRALLRKRLAGIDIPPAGGLQAIANALNRGDTARAQIAALHLKLPPFEPKMLRRIGKANFDPNQPRDGHGMWTSDGGDESDDNDLNTTLASTREDPMQAKKKRFVKAHLDAALKAAKQLNVPVENILGLSALESNWGDSRFATKAKNFFSIYAGAPYATGSIRALVPKEDGTYNYLSTFDSYSQSLQSFIKVARKHVENVSDPETFAKALQDAGQYGINVNTGKHDADFVGDVVSTINHLRPMIEQRLHETTL